MNNHLIFLEIVYYTIKNGRAIPYVFGHPLQEMDLRKNKPKTLPVVGQGGKRVILHLV